MESKIRWGIVGLGGIAHHFVKDLLLVNDAVLTGVASRNIDKAKDFASAYGATHYFESYQKLFECKEVDVVYIATPHTSHAELAIQAMNTGKHVLCEKPIGINASEVQKMFKVAKENKVFLMEALWTRFNPSIKKIIDEIENDTIGPIKYLHADFAFYALNRDKRGRLLNPELAGGSLLDIGIYPIFLAYLLLDKPEDIMATANFYDTGVEIQTSIIFKYANAQAVLYSGLNSNSEMKAEISGTKGTIYIHPRWHEAQGFTKEIANEKEIFDLPTNGRGYLYEIEEVNTCLRENKLESDVWSHQNSMDLILLLDKIRGLVGVKFPFE